MSTSEHIQPLACPRYQACSAPICPLDADWPKRSHLPEDRVCRWLTELAKPGGIAILEGVLEGVLARRVAEVSPAILARTGRIRDCVRRAATTGSKIEADRIRMAKARLASPLSAPRPGMVA
jgi:hypothetical protein